DLDYIEKKWYPEIFEVAINTSIGAIGGPVMTASKHSIFYVVDKIEPQLKDFLGVKRTIFQKLTKQQKDQAIQLWVDERLKETTIEIDEDALWTTIDESKYAQTDTTGNN
ncbi:MAG: peptidylprolyl isomerase, partial [Candidatus Zixiibacteriota bacterium]